MTVVSRPVTPRHECVQHDFMWSCCWESGHAYVCQLCGYGHDGRGNEIETHLTCCTGNDQHGEPQVIRYWAPIR